MTDIQPQDIPDLQELPLTELMVLALQAKLRHRGTRFSFCSIINAKSGRCSEDCSFCVQSGHYRTQSPIYPLKDREEIVAAAHEAKRIGAQHFSIVTSGRGLPSKEIDRVAEIVAAIRKQVNIRVCASLGIQSSQHFKQLKAAGLSRYHHNIETSREFFPRVVSTHTFADRLKTIQAAQDAGLEVCAGGIIGLGETEADRISMAMTLRECRVDSVPLNILVPLPGTPMQEANSLNQIEILRSIALFRLIVPEVPLRLAAGRETALRDFLGMALMAGADGLMIGGYLTQRGRPPEEDHRLVAEIKLIWNTLLAS